MRIAAAALLALSPILAPTTAHAQTQAPFCLVSNSGYPSCFYYSLDACRSAQGSLGGMCTANIQAQQGIQAQPILTQQTLQHPDIAGSYMRGAQAGQEMRIREQEHRARMEMIEAQRASYSVPAPQVAVATQVVPSTGNEQNVLYRCRLQGGGTYYTSAAIEGCTALQVAP